MSEFHKGVARDLDACNALSLFILASVDYAQAARRLGAGGRAADGRRQQRAVARQAEGLLLHRLPVDVPGPGRGIVGDVALVQKFIANAIGDVEIRLQDGVLPRDGILVQCRVMVIIPFPDYLIVKGMVGEMDPGGDQTVVLRLVPWKEADINVGRLEVHASGLGRIKGDQRRLDIGYRVRILEAVAEHDHVVRHVLRRHRAPGRGSVVEDGARAEGDDGHQELQRSFHSPSSVSFPVAK